MPDAIFVEPRLAALYDSLNADRADLDVYAAMTAEFSAVSILDVGCGTGTLACLLAEPGLRVIAADPALASLAVARAKPGADAIRWLHASAADVPANLDADLAFMTGNVAQVFVTDSEWAEALAAVRNALAPAGRLAFESRDPARRAWLEWDEARVRRNVPGLGIVERRIDLTEVTRSLVSFRMTFAFPDGSTAASDSTLRFRSRDELAASVAAAGLVVDEVRDAPDRPGHEFVFITSRARGS